MEKGDIGEHNLEDYDMSESSTSSDKMDFEQPSQSESKLVVNPVETSSEDDEPPQRKVQKTTKKKAAKPIKKKAAKPIKKKAAEAVKMRASKLVKKAPPKTKRISLPRQSKAHFSMLRVGSEELAIPPQDVKEEPTVIETDTESASKRKRGGRKGKKTLPSQQLPQISLHDEETQDVKEDLTTIASAMLAQSEELPDMVTTSQQAEPPEAVASTSQEVVASTSQEVVASTSQEVVASTSQEVVASTSQEVVASTSQEVGVKEEAVAPLPDVEAEAAPETEATTSQPSTLTVRLTYAMASSNKTFDELMELYRGETPKVYTPLYFDPIEEVRPPQPDEEQPAPDQEVAMEEGAASKDDESKEETGANENDAEAALEPKQEEPEPDSTEKDQE